MPAHADQPIEAVRRLFPFHFTLGAAADEIRIAWASERFESWLGPLAGRTLADAFTIHRPSIDSLTLEALRSLESKAVVLEHRETGRRLRGEIIDWSDGQFIFVGSPVMTGQSIRELGLQLSDFPGYDSAPELVIMTQLAKVRVADIERQQASIAHLAEARDALDAQASTDELTQLPNRRALWEAWEIARRVDGPDACRTLVYVDVDGFKRVNDEHGHHFGDDLLRVLASRMRNAAGPADVVARIGGDEFVLLLERASEDEAQMVAEQIHAHLCEPVKTAVTVADLTVSMGVTHSRLEESLDDALLNADTAMYRGRAIGSGRLTVFVPSMGSERRERSALTQDLRKALRNRTEIEPWFQPIVALDSHRIVGFEALGRWFHPEVGLVMPDTFVPLAEGAGLVGDLDRAILLSSLATFAPLLRSQPELSLHVNLSGRTLNHGTAAQIRTALDAFDVRAESLVVEVTETWFIDHQRALDLHAIADLGVQLQLDDFGTGFSSLSHLQTFPITGLKIDRSFVAGLAESDRDRRLVRATLSLAKSLELEVVAEGVETVAVANALRDLDCLYAQGYLFAAALERRDALDLGRAGLLTPR